MTRIVSSVAAGILVLQISSALDSNAADAGKAQVADSANQATAAAAPIKHKRGTDRKVHIEGRAPAVPTACDAVVFPRHPLCPEADWFSFWHLRWWPL